MPYPTPFHPRTSELCTSLQWKEWAGYHAVRSFDVHFDAEYYAFRHSCGMIDVTPLYKYDVQGPDAAQFLRRVMVKDVSRLKVGQVTYLCWCDDDGKVIDDGTVTRVADDNFRVTAADPNYHWLVRCSRGYDVTVSDVSDRVAALSLQGPTSRDVLNAACDKSINKLRFFRSRPNVIAGAPVTISRTGYTGDLGYEVWVENKHALTVWDALMEAGRPIGILPAGLDAMDVTRVEAGFVLAGIDYYNALHTMTEPRKSSPYEIDLGWTVQLDREPFIGQAALQREHDRGPSRVFVGLDIDWDELEGLFREHRLPPEIHHGGWRDPVPIYDQRNRYVGQATSGAWSPLLKKNFALAMVTAQHGGLGTELRFEVTVEYERRTVPAVVVEKPFFNPERKRSVPR